jgi:hypothetical protein
MACSGSQVMRLLAALAACSATTATAAITGVALACNLVSKGQREQKVFSLTRRNLNFPSPLQSLLWETIVLQPRGQSVCHKVYWSNRRWCFGSIKNGVLLMPHLGVCLCLSRLLPPCAGVPCTRPQTALLLSCIRSTMQAP